MSTLDNRLKMLRMRSWRRGTKEMDLILGPFSDREITQLGADDLDLYERLLTENDQDLYLWVTGASEGPQEYSAMLARIARGAGLRAG